MHSTVPVRGAADTFDTDIDDEWADWAGRESRPFGAAGSDARAAIPRPLEAVPTWRWLASRRLQRGAVAVLLLELALVIGFVAMYRPFDLNIYLWGGHAVRHGLRLYLVQADQNWFTYPPFAAALFGPLTGLPGLVVRLAWELGSVAALALACAFTLRLGGYRPTRNAIVALTAAAVVLEPVYHTLFLGQVNLFLLALVLADLWRVARGRPAGIGIGVAAAIKLVPGIFILLLLATRRFRDAAIATATFAVCGLVGFIVDPSASRLYWTQLFFNPKRVSDAYISNQSLYSAALRILGGPAHLGLWFFVLVQAVGAAGLAVAAVLGRRGDWLGAAAVTGVTGLLVSPVSWTHHWVWIVPALVVLMRGGRRAQGAAGIAYVLFALAPMWFTPHPVQPGPAEPGWHGLMTITANCFLVAGLAFIAYMTVVTLMARAGVRAAPLGRGDAAATAEPLLERELVHS